MERQDTESKWNLAMEWLVLIAILALATFLRYWRIEEVPPGFNSDEAVGAMGALTTLREGIQYSYEGQGGGGALGFYFAAAAFYLFGPSIATIRGLAAWAGLVSLFANYWAVRELFRTTGLNQARWIAMLSTLGLSLSLWHISASRIAFAGIGVPFLMLPSTYFLWRGLNKNQTENRKSLWPFIVSGIFLAGLMYIYLSGVFFPPFYAVFFVSQWLLVKLVKKFNGTPNPPESYLTTQFWSLLATAVTAAILLLPIIYVLLIRPEADPAATRVSQAFFLNPQINQGDPWGLLWRSIVGNFGAYGVSLSWFIGRPPNLSTIPVQLGLMIFLGFLIALWYSLRGVAAYLYIWLWYGIMLLPSILSPDQIPHNLRTIGATTPAFVFAAIFIVWLFNKIMALSRPWLQPRLGSPGYKWVPRVVGLGLALFFISILWKPNRDFLYGYFYYFPTTNDAKAAYHVYAIDIAERINQETESDVAYILPRNTAAGDVFPNFTTDFLTELEQPTAAHYWIVDDETTLAETLTTAAKGHRIMRLVQWKTSKHTGADPKGILTYYLEKQGHFAHSKGFEYFDVHTYILENSDPDFQAAESLTPTDINFGDQLKLTGYAFGDAGDAATVAKPQARSNNLLWLRLAWQKIGTHPEDLKASVQIYTEDGQLVTQLDRHLISNILQVPSSKWGAEAREESYFLILIPPATPPGEYQLRLAVYGADTLTHLPATGQEKSISLANLTILPALEPITPNDVNLALPIRQELLPGVTLLGFEALPGETVRAGQPVEVSLIWQAGGSPQTQALAMTLVVKPGEGKEEWTLLEPVGLAGNAYPSSLWQPGEILRGRLRTRIPPEFEPGLYKLSLRLTDRSGQEVLTLPIGDFNVSGWPRNFVSPQPQINVGATYGERATLVGLDVTANVIAPGESLTTRLYWRAEQPFAEDYTAFVQLIGPDGLLHGQVDQTPGAGQFPTSGWLPGEYISDDYSVRLNPDAPPGDYKIAIGLYHPVTGQRLAVTGGNCQFDVCLLPGLTVK